MSEDSFHRYCCRGHDPRPVAEEDAARLFSGVETGGVVRGGSEKPAGPVSL